MVQINDYNRYYNYYSRENDKYTKIREINNKNDIVKLNYRKDTVTICDAVFSYFYK